VGVEYPIALVATEATAAETIVLLGDAAAWNWLPLSGAFGANVAAWVPVVVIYGFVASVLPVWVLLQPRDFLTSSLLYTGVGAMLLGVIVAVFIGFDPVTVTVAGEQTQISSLQTQYPAFRGFTSELGPIFPFLFVTIACGTISGFHSLVSSGTTAKQLDQESDARDIGYGAMLGEGLLATTAVGAFAIIGFTEFSAGVVGALNNFPAGGAAMVSAIPLPIATGTLAAFIGLVFVSFLLTSTDTAVRLGRYMLDEIVGVPETSVERTATNRYVSSGLLLCAPAYVLVGSGTWSSLWPLFGGANQTLAALALLAATLWLANWDDTKQLLSTGLPMALMLVITVTALLWIGLLRAPGSLLGALAEGQWFQVASFGIQSLISLTLAALAVSLAWMGYKNIREAREGVTGAAPSDD
jgi:carbon starvation protein